MICNQLAEHPGIDLLPHEALRDPDAVDRFGQRGGDAAEALLLLAVRLAQTRAEMAVDQPDDRRDGQHRAEKHRVRVEHHQPGDEHLDHLHEADEEHVLHAQAHRVDVRGHAADDAPEFRAVVETHRHALEIGEHVRAQIVDDGFAQVEDQPDAEVEIHACPEREQTERGRAQQRAAQVAVRDGTLDDPADHPGADRQLHRADQYGSQQPEQQVDLYGRVYENSRRISARSSGRWAGSRSRSPGPPDSLGRTTSVGIGFGDGAVAFMRGARNRCELQNSFAFSWCL